MKVLIVIVVLVALVNIEASRVSRDRRMIDRDYDRNVRYDDNNREDVRVRDRRQVLLRRDNRQRVAEEYADTNVVENGKLMDIFWSYFLKGFTVSVIAYQLLSEKNRPIVKQFLGFVFIF